MRGVLLVVAVLVAIGVFTFVISGPIYARIIFPDPSPSQPIAFSHKTHAQQNQISCIFCHNFPVKSPVAGMPSIEKCIDCHEFLPDVKDHQDVKQLTKLWQQKKSIRWVRVYDLPDYVHFPHDRHVRSGISCDDCHGNVSSMVRVTKSVDLSMGWCLDCHRALRGTPAIEPGERLSPPVDCQECHK